MYRTHFVSEIGPELEGKEVEIAGWIFNVRDLGGKKFLLIRDKTGLGQAVLAKDSPSFSLANELSQESVVKVKGKVKADKRAPRGAEIHVEELELISKAKSPLPLDVTGKVKADLDTRLRERLLDLRREEMNAVIKIQSVAVKAFRETLYKKGFYEIFTPKLIATGTEGGAQLFTVIYFGKEAFLAQSPQLYKELMAGAVERVFEIAPAWRAEDSDTPYHLSEFVSMDVEMAFSDYNEVMHTLEDIISNILEKVRSECENELKALNYSLPEVRFPLKRITYSEALEILNGKGIDLKFGDDIGTPELRVLNEELKEDLYFVTDWPTLSRPFYTRAKNENSDLSESFDLIFRFLEIVSGSSRNYRREVLENALKARGLNPSSFEFFLRWFDYGMPPHAGFGMGLSRLMLMLTGLQNVKEIVPFPRDKKRLVP
ncbi:aspartate--tRNA(Asn) ligase [Sulfuracidifex tepidarius]|uniref:Aspartate--tRNA(Asp/Asn) ligase n=1 Tax=Sulfuracidifex tepidarius TaxID=1294262 RepID=A0A510E4E6_9CREN|nr:aspartate--tRNA(Asn) ligase [Sulfuracidifex tepidarius]BBG24558.1 Aspartate--tRNA(Asp/Asn) ligase [Sulfuracidifex tepidarius]BBG27346.1 Aspartate--tRNA(Asp/Asn) ligase [Sulfuracidifex tepidarius]